MTYIEVHVGGMHGEPLLIHQLESYAVQYVEGPVIL